MLADLFHNFVLHHFVILVLSSLGCGCPAPCDLWSNLFRGKEALADFASRTCPHHGFFGHNVGTASFFFAGTACAGSSLVDSLPLT